MLMEREKGRNGLTRECEPLVKFSCEYAWTKFLYNSQTITINAMMSSGDQ